MDDKIIKVQGGFIDISKLLKMYLQQNFINRTGIQKGNFFRADHCLQVNALNQNTSQNTTFRRDKLQNHQMLKKRIKNKY
ncbi:hypothetical protein pb186bvf_011257 [Paramecium bursaria]